MAVLLNGLGSVKYEELFVLWDAVRPLLEAAGLDVVAPEVGELVTSLDMAGCSLTVSWLDDELERLWLAPADSPAFRRTLRLRWTRLRCRSAPLCRLSRPRPRSVSRPGYA